MSTTRPLKSVPLSSGRKHASHSDLRNPPPLSPSASSTNSNSTRNSLQPPSRDSVVQLQRNSNGRRSVSPVPPPSPSRSTSNYFSDRRSSTDAPPSPGRALDHREDWENESVSTTYSADEDDTSAAADSNFGRSSTEYKVAKAGWLWRRTNLMQWKRCYAIAKHGNAVKPGGLYLYKDDKLTSHRRTIDMSACVEIEPKQQEYKPNLRWEFRMLVKREDVVLATDDAPDRKAWIDALASIMGKVSAASHAELQTRAAQAQQRNRNLERDRSELEAECVSLRRRIAEVEEETARRQEAVKREFAAREERLARELEDAQHAHARQVELLERQLSIWRGKAQDTERRYEGLVSVQARQRSDISKMEQLEVEVRRWQGRCAELERVNEGLRLEARYSSGGGGGGGSGGGGGGMTMMHNISNGGSASTVPSAFDTMMAREQAAIRETVDEIRHIVSATSPEDADVSRRVENHVIEVKTGVLGLAESVRAAHDGWGRTQEDIMKFLENEQAREGEKEEGWREALRDVKRDLLVVKDEVVGTEEAKEGENIDTGRPATTLRRKFDALLELVQFIQVSQARLVSFWLDDTAGLGTARGNIDDNRMNTVQKFMEELDERSRKHDTDAGVIQDLMAALHQKLSTNADETSGLLEAIRVESIAAWEKVEAAVKGEGGSRAIGDRIERSLSDLAQTMQMEMQLSHEQGERAAQEQTRMLAALEKLTQNVEGCGIPNLAAFNAQLQDLLNRMAETECRLSQAANVAGPGSAIVSPRQAPMSTTSYANLPSPVAESSVGVKDMVKETRALIERVLRVLDKFGGSNAGLEDTIRRAVADSLVPNSSVTVSGGGTSVKEFDMRLRQYEGNAKEYMEQALEEMRAYMTEHHGALYDLIEQLVEKSVKELADELQGSVGGGASGASNEELEELKQHIMEAEARLKVVQEETTYFINVQTALGAERDTLEAEAERLREEVERLDGELNTKKEDLKDIEEELRERKEEAERIREECVKMEREVWRTGEGRVRQAMLELDELEGRLVQRLKGLVEEVNREGDKKSKSNGVVQETRPGPRPRTSSISSPQSYPAQSPQLQPSQFNLHNSTASSNNSRALPNPSPSTSTSNRSPPNPTASVSSSNTDPNPSPSSSSSSPRFQSRERPVFQQKSYINVAGRKSSYEQAMAASNITPTSSPSPPPPREAIRVPNGARASVITARRASAVSRPDRG